jgi:hypothetical protein
MKLESIQALGTFLMYYLSDLMYQNESIYG